MAQRTNTGSTRKKPGPKTTKPAQKAQPQQDPQTDEKGIPSIDEKVTPKANKIQEVETSFDEKVAAEVDNQKKSPIMPHRYVKTYPAKVNGVERDLTVDSFEVLAKDPSRFTIELPKGSPLFAYLPESKPCKDC